MEAGYVCVCGYRQAGLWSFITSPHLILNGLDPQCTRAPGIIPGVYVRWVCLIPFKADINRCHTYLLITFPKVGRLSISKPAKFFLD